MAAVGLEPLEHIENMQLTHYTKFLKRTNRSIGTSGVRGVYTALRKVSTEVEFSSLGLGRLECFLSAGRVCDKAGDGIREHDDRALRFGRRFPQFSKLDIGGEGGIRVRALRILQVQTCTVGSNSSLSATQSALMRTLVVEG